MKTHLSNSHTVPQVAVTSSPSPWLGLAVPFLLALLAITTARGEDSAEKLLADHRQGAEKIADDQDELSADVQQLVIEQTIPQVITLLGEVETLMDEATDRLSEADTSGQTIAAQTEIIEKIHAAAKARQCEGQGSASGSAMMDMMERMMGKQDGNQQGKEKADSKSDQAGQGNTGDSDSPNTNAPGTADGQKDPARRVPKAAGSAGVDIPAEFRKAFDAYNRGAEKLVK